VKPQAGPSNTQMEPTRPTVLCDPVTAARGSFATLDVWLGHLKILADLPGEVVVDFAMARNAGGFLGGAIQVNRVVASLTQQLAAVLFEMSNQVSALQALTFSSSRITSGPGASS